MVCYDRTIFGWDTTIWKSWIWGCKKNLNTEKITFKVVQMKFLAMHISNQKLSFYIFTVGKFTKCLHGSSFLNVLMIFGIKEKSIILTHTMNFLAIATNITIYIPIYSYLRLVLWSRQSRSSLYAEYASCAGPPKHQGPPCSQRCFNFSFVLEFGQRLWKHEWSYLLMWCAVTFSV